MWWYTSLCVGLGRERADFIAVFTTSAQWRSNQNDSITPIRLDNDFDVGCVCLQFLIFFRPSSSSLLSSLPLFRSIPHCCQHFAFIFPQRSNTCIRLQGSVQRKIVCFSSLKKKPKNIVPLYLHTFPDREFLPLLFLTALPSVNVAISSLQWWVLCRCSLIFWLSYLLCVTGKWQA